MAAVVVGGAQRFVFRYYRVTSAVVGVQRFVAIKVLLPLDNVRHD